MTNKTMKRYKAKFMRCQGACKICFDEGDCPIEKQILKNGLEKVKKLIYNE